MPKAKVTHERLMDALSYDASTSIFTWLEASNGRIKVGQMAGTPNGNVHLQIKIDRKKYWAHRLAWFYVTGKWPVADIDHRDLDGMNNRFSNLREATRSQNCCNQTARKNNTSGYKGVCWHKASGKWTAATMIDGKSAYLGVFDTPEAAHAAYRATVEKHHGEFARAA